MRRVFTHHPGRTHRPGPRRLYTWLVSALLVVLVLYGGGLAALLATRGSYLDRARLYISVDDSLAWQGRTGLGYRVWTAGPGSFELWRAYQWVPAIREARGVWEEGHDGQRSATGSP